MLALFPLHLSSLILVQIFQKQQQNQEYRLENNVLGYFLKLLKDDQLVNSWLTTQIKAIMSSRAGDPNLWDDHRWQCKGFTS